MSSFFSLWKGLLTFRASDYRTMAEILADVAARHSLTVETLKTSGRRKGITEPRQEAMWEMYATGRFSLHQIGNFLGGRDHSTILHGRRAHALRVAAIRPQSNNNPDDDRDCHSALRSVA